jgi:predicted DNA-binding transcriptional regulator AlpA
MQPLLNNEDYLLSLYEVCEILGKSTRTITRYVHKHILHPRGIKSRQGTLEYRFSRSEIDAFKQREDSVRQYFYLENKHAPEVSQAASFADYQFPVPPTQTPYLIPGISFPVQSNPQSSLPATPTQSPKKNPIEQDLPNIEVRIKAERPDADEKDKPAKTALQKDVESALAQKRNDDEIIILLKETTGMLRDQLKTKDDQIKNLDDKIGQLIERNRETNILLKGLQDKIMLLEKPRDENAGRAQRPDSNEVSQPAHKPEVSPAASAVTVENASQNASVRVKILSDLKPTKGQDTGASFVAAVDAPAIDAVPRPNPVTEKKSLFGKFFGQ